MPYVSPAIKRFDNKYLDIDLAEEARRIDRKTGCTPSDLGLMMGMEDYEAGQKIYTRRELPDLIEENDKNKAWKLNRIVDRHDQNGDVSCVYNMLAAAIETEWNETFGDHNHIMLSPMSGYRWNGSSRSGSNIYNSSSWGENTGLVPNRNDRNAKLVEKGYFRHTHPHNGYRSSFMNGWKDTAKCFRLQEWYRISSLEAWWSASIAGFGLCGGRDGHAIFHPALAMDGRNLYGVYLNSWGSWGSTLRVSGDREMRAFGYDSERKISAMIRNGAYACRTIVRPSWMKLGIVL